jgi:ribonuclease BN (tRNA processing enzyme)
MLGPLQVGRHNTGACGPPPSDRTHSRGVQHDANLARSHWEGCHEEWEVPRRQFLHLAAAAVALPALSLVARAQPSSDVASPRKGTRVITLGTKNGPFPSVGRAQSSNLLVVNGAQYVIDAGEGVTRRLARLGTNFRNIDNIFITHPHSDHTGGLGGLMTVVYDTNRRSLVNIYGPPGTAASVKGLLEFLTVSSEIRISDGTHTVPATKIFSGHDTGVGMIFQDTNIKVTAVENSHFHFPPGSPGYGKYKSYSYRFDAADRSVVFTGDTGPSEAVAELAKGVDLLVSEVTNPVDEYKAQQIKSGRWQQWTPEEQTALLRHHVEEHLLPDELGKLAARANVKTVVLTHLNDDYIPFAEEVKKHFSGQVLVAKDLMEF